MSMSTDGVARLHVEGRPGVDVDNSTIVNVALPHVQRALGFSQRPGVGGPGSRPICNQALTNGFSRAFEVSAGIWLLALLIAIATIRVSRRELVGAGPEPHEAAPPPAPAQPETVPPGTAQRQEDRGALAAAVRPCPLC